ncbi:PREDICTED: unconventional myosin-XVIIIb [Dipodomys ordii]|uniref:Unconventional myosin-XVIIIb n=1 Tax=Dipodomys ordii TaxID=10020 RepID=A0A1S3EZ86_DIPOR|nr:PREDICTED: unconventional myosin-XVIIIb [Dipodomys ordii]
MAISSRLALWEQKESDIREEDKTPPPSSPPPLFSVIPGGFIKQLVRETEKESKEARRRKEAALASPEREVGSPRGGVGSAVHPGSGHRVGSRVHPGSIPQPSSRHLLSGPPAPPVGGVGADVVEQPGPGSPPGLTLAPPLPSACIWLVCPCPHLSRDNGPAVLANSPTAERQLQKHRGPVLGQGDKEAGSVPTRTLDRGLEDQAGVRVEASAARGGEDAAGCGPGRLLCGQERKTELREETGVATRSGDPKGSSQGPGQGWAVVSMGTRLDDHDVVSTPSPGQPGQRSPYCAPEVSIAQSSSKTSGAPRSGSPSSSQRATPAADPGGAENQAAPPAGPGALTREAQTTRPGGLGGTGRGAQEQRSQSAVGKGSRVPPTKQPKRGEPQGQEEQRTRPQAPGAGDGGQPQTAGGGAPQNKTDKEALPQEGGHRIRTEPRVPARKWGASLSKKSKGETPPSKKDKAGPPQTKTEERGAGQEPGAQAGEATRGLEEAGGPPPVAGETGVPQKTEAPGEAAGAQSVAEKGCAEPPKAAPRGPPPEASGTEDRPDRGTQGAQESSGIAEGGVPQPQLEPVPETPADQPSTQKPADQGRGPQEPCSGDQSPDPQQAGEGRWYEAEKVWLVQKDGFELATVLKPDEGTADLPAGRVRLCLDSNRSVMEVDEDRVHRANPPELDQAEDLASLVSVNEPSVLNTLLRRYQAQRPHTCAGPDLIVLRPPGPLAGQVPRAPWDRLPAHVGSLAQRAYWALLSQRRDQSIVALGRSGAGKTACCQQVLEHLVQMAGGVDGRVAVDKIRAAFTVLRAFGSACTNHGHAATKFAMAMSLDFSATGRVTAAQLQTMLLETSRVSQRPEGEGNFQVFSQMLAGLDLDLRTELNLHQMADGHAFGMGDWSKPEDKQKAAAGFARLRAAMDALSISQGEQRAVWRVLAAIYHLGAAGACKVGRKQFMRFECANHAAEALGCEFEELNTATFKHHLRQIIQRATAGPRRGAREDEEAAASAGLKMTGVECVEGMAAGLYQELFSAVVSLINRSFCSQHLSMASITVVDAAGFQNPRHQGRGRAATFEELCHNYAQERLQLLFYQRTFVSTLERFREEGIPVHFDLPESSLETTVALMDQNPSQVHVAAGGGPEDARGLFWLLDEEVRVEGSSDSVVLERLRAAFEKKGAGEEGPPALRTCEQPLQCEVFHQLGQDPVRYDLTGWLHRAKPNLSALDAPQLLHQSKREELLSLFQAQAKLPPVCQALAGLAATSPQALQRNRVLRRAFAGSLGALKRRASCAQIKLQMDALVSLLSRSQLHFIHCLLPAAEVESDAGGEQPGAGQPQALDVPALRAQLAGSHILQALRLHRAGFADHMGLPQFRRRFQALDPALLKRLASGSEGVDERQAVEELLHTLDLEAQAVALGPSQVFLKAGVVSRLEKQREKMVARSIVLFQAACRGFLSRQELKKLKVHRLAARCIQKNVAAFLAVKDWPWWQLLASLRPLLSATVGTEQLRAKEEELSALRRKLEKSESLRNELRQSSDLLQSKIADLTAELADERFRGDVACQALESERAERLQAFRQVQELKSKCEQVQKSLGDVEKRLEEAEHKVQLSELESKPAGSADEWQMRLDCAQIENDFLRKRLQQCEERLDSELASKKELEQKLGELQSAYEEAKKTAQQLKRRCHHLTWDLDDARVLLENQQSRNHELEKKQKKFDLQLAQALGEAVCEKNLREKAAQESSSVRWELGQLQKQLQQKEQEAEKLQQEAAALREHKRELLAAASLRGDGGAAGLKERLWAMESQALEQAEAQRQQESAIRRLEQVRERLELEMECMKQMYQKGREDQEEELEDVRQSCQKRLWQLEMQLEQEHEEKQMALHQKQDLETLIGNLCEQIGHRDFDVEKRLRRDLRRTHALLSDVQLLLTTMDDSKTSASKEELEKMRSQLEQSKAKCEDALKTQKALTVDLEAMHSELESMARSKSLVDEQLFRLQFEKADLLKRIDEDQDDLNDLMQKHKDLIAQSAADIGQIQELHLQLEEARKEKQKLQEQLQVAQTRIEYLEQSTVDRAIVSRQEAVVCDLESKTEFQKVQIKRFEVLVIRLRDSLIKMGEELSQATMAETQQRENSQYYQRRLEEMKAEMEELVQREAAASRRCMELEKYVEELGAVRQILQTDLETSIRRIADLQAALEEVASSDSDTESVQTAVDCGSRGRKEADNLSTISSQPEGSLQSWLSCTLSLATDTVRTPSRQSVNSSHVPRTKEETRDDMGSTPATAALGRAWESEPRASRGDGVSPRSPCHLGDQRKASERPGSLSPSLGSPSPPRSPLPRDKLPSPSAALSEFVEGLRRKRVQRGGRGSPLHLEDWPALPIYQTTGASTLRRGRASSDEGALSLGMGASPSPPEAAGASGLLRCASLKCIPSGDTAGTELLPERTKTRFSSCESLLESGRKLSPAGAPRDPLRSPSLRPRRRCLEASVDDAGTLELGTEPLVFQNRQFAHLMEEPLSGGDPFSWKLPGLPYGHQAPGGFDDFLPAIRKPATPPSSAGAAKDKQHPSVPFETEEADPSFVSGIKTIVQKSPGSQGDPAHLSDSSDSSSSIVSLKSNPSAKSRLSLPRPEGDGGERTSPYRPEPGATGRNEDVESIMKKYLQK